MEKRFEGPFESLNTLWDKVNESQELVEVALRRLKRRSLTSAIQNRAKVTKNSRFIYSTLDAKHQNLRNVIDVLEKFLNIAKEQGLLYDESCVESLKKLRQVIYEDMIILRKEE